MFHREIADGVLAPSDLSPRNPWWDSLEGEFQRAVLESEGRNVTIGEKKMDDQCAYINMHTLTCQLSINLA